MRRRVARQKAENPRVVKRLDLPPEWCKSRFDVEAERRWAVERAGMDPESRHAFAPRQRLGLAHQPSPQTLAVEFWNQAQESQFAFRRHPEIQFQHAHFHAPGVDHRIDDDIGIVDDRDQRVFVHDQPRKPQPGFADSPEQRAIGLGLGLFPLYQS
jgi:hypothetical protein